MAIPNGVSTNVPSQLLHCSVVPRSQTPDSVSPGADCSLGRGDSGFLRHPSRCPSSVHAFVAIKTPSLRRAALFSVAGKGDTL